MAKDMGDYPGNWKKMEKETWEQYDNRTHHMYNAIDHDKIISFPIADGKACYFVKSIKPPQLLLIPIGDAWFIPDAHMRGLTSSDIRKKLEQTKAMREIFNGGK